MRRCFWLLLCLVLMTGKVFAQQVTGAEITWYGVYTAASDERTSEKTISRGITPPDTDNDRIPMVSGTRFGYGYKLTGSPGSAQVTLKYIIKVPSENDEVTYWPGLAINRTDLFIGYIFDSSSPTGMYILQVWYGTRLLAEKSFNVVKE